MADSYAYRVRTREGRVVEGKMEADTESIVASRLRSQGLVPIQISREGKISGKTEIRVLPQRVKLKDLAIFSRQFATMINSGLSLLRTLNILSEQTENPLLAKTIGFLRDDVERGSSLSAAMSKHPKVFTPLFVAMVRAGETGGQLDAVLMRVADNYEADYKLRQKVKSAMTYPVVVAGIAIILTLSAKAKFLFPLFVVALVGLTIAYKRIRKANAEARLRFDHVKLRIPIFGALFKKVAISRFTRTLALLLRAGVPVLQTFDITSQSTGNEVLARAAQEVKESVRSGESMSAPLAKHNVFPPMVVQMIAVGEDTGALDAMLDKISDFYDQEVESTTESLTALIEPVMIAMLGGIVGAMVIALYMPMFKIFDLIK